MKNHPPRPAARGRDRVGEPARGQRERRAQDGRRALDAFRRTLGDPLRVLAGACAGLLVLALLFTLYAGRAFLMPVVIALVMAGLLRPPVRWLHRLHVPNALGAGLVLIILVSGFVFGMYSLGAPAAEWVERAPSALRQAERRVRNLMEPVERVREAAGAMGDMGGDDSSPEQTTEVQIAGTGVVDTILSQTQQFLVGALVVLFLLYFLLASGDLFLRKLVRVLPHFHDRKQAVRIARRIEADVSRYLFTITAINILFGLTVWAAMAAIGMPTPLLWGVFAGVLNFMPYIGPVITGAVLALVALVTFDDFGRALLVPAAYFAINLLEAYLITPVILGRRLELNAVAVFLAVIFWGWLWGIPGALLAIPLLASVKIIADHIDLLSPVGEFLGR